MSEPIAQPWIAAQTGRLLKQRGHAWLLGGPSGLGQYALALSLVQAWLCEHSSEQGACGHCPACHAVEVRTHADLCVLMPETLMLELGWPLSEKAQSDIDEKKRKPSREIRVEAMRDAVEFAQRTNARGRGKAVLIYPADRMNTVTGNALLKTLEEPPGDLRFVLASDAVHLLLPTVRSRCQMHAMDWPATAQALEWLGRCGVDSRDAEVFLRASGGRPDDAWQMARSGLSAAAWRGLPRAMAQGDVGAVAQWNPARLLDALQKICHDLLACQYQATPRFFHLQDLPVRPEPGRLSQWSRELMRCGRTVEHPFNPGLMLEALVSQASDTLNSGT